MNIANYPKLMIVNSQAFHYENGPGITLSNLFRGWPKEKIAMVHDDHILAASDVCEQYYSLGKEEAHWILPIGKVVSAYRRSAGVYKNASDAQPAKCASFGKAAWRRLEFIREILQPRDIFLRYQVSEHLANWVKAFAPDIIYTQPASICHMSLARQIQDLSGAKMVIHIMDDWPMLFLYPDITHRFRARQTLEWLRQMINHSSLRLTISKKMADEYSKRYGREFYAFHNPAVMSLPCDALPSVSGKSGPATVVYSGGISSRNQLSALKTLCETIEFLNQSGLSVEFHIYTHPRWQVMYSRELQSRHVVFKEYVTDQAKIDRIYRESDLLVIPLSFEKESVKYVSLSMPTKVSSYMASGTPILVYASDETALADYAKTEGWAFVVSRRSEDELRRMMKIALNSDELRTSYRNRALAVARENHESNIVQKKFHSLMTNMV